MADHAYSSEAAPATELVAEEAFAADRQQFWSSFTHFVVICAAGVVVLLVLMALFLL